MDTEDGIQVTTPIDQNSNNDDQLSNSLLNPRKRPYDGAAADEDIDQGHNDDDIVANGAPGHDSKRSRGSKWHLDKAQSDTGKGSRGRGSRQKISSPRQKRHSNSTPRPSKFLEGSMNDRASKKPPSPYLGEEIAMEQYAATQTVSTRPSVDTNTFYDAGIESNKPSGMYRFGKAIASAFNPSAWRGFNGIWKEKDKPAVDPGKALMNERQEKAQKAYAELKKSGFKGTQGSSRLSTAADDIPAFRYDDTSTQDSRHTSFRDSAIDVEDYRSSSDYKGDPRSFVREEDLMPAPNVPLVSRSISPMPSTSGRRSSLTLRTPSFQTLKKATSHIQLPSVKRHSVQSDISDSSQQIKKQPSKKDLVKQQKLVKRVSNLETQLESARRELELALASTPAAEAAEKPGRKAFKPGALPSLPSERILNARLTGEKVDGGDAGPGPIKTRSAAKGALPTVDPASQLHEELQDTATAKTPSRKRKSRLSLDRDTTHKLDDAEEWDVPADPVPAKTPAKRGRPRKTQKVESPNLPMPARPIRRTTSLGRTTPSSELRRPSTLRTWKHKDIPPVPSLPTPVSPSQVDKVAILSMRTTHDIKIPFGESSEDLQNLRKTYPLLSDAQVEQLLGKSQPDGKVTDHTSTVHQGRPASPALAPPSPTKTLGFKPSISKSSLRSSKKEPKGPNNSPAELPGIYGTRGRTKGGKFVKLKSEEAEEGDVVADLSPSKARKELPPYPKSSAEKSQDGENEKGSEKDKEKEKDKPLPKVQLESYDWDEDVF